MNNLRMQKIINKIRTHFERKKPSDNPFNNDLDKWKLCCVSMDTLEDTALAMEYYDRSPLSDDDGEKYLKLYGCLQAIFLQQDSIKSLYEIYVSPINKYPKSWKALRALRNLTVGHPLEKKAEDGIKRCFISRISISKEGFQYLIWDSKKRKNTFENVNLIAMVLGYQKEAESFLAEICNSLENNR